MRKPTSTKYRSRQPKKTIRTKRTILRRLAKATRYKSRPVAVRYLLSVERSILQTYWRFLYAKKPFHQKIVGILNVEPRQFKKTSFGWKHPSFENVTTKKTVFHNDLIETALVSDFIYVFGPNVLLKEAERIHGREIYVKRIWKNKSKVIRVPISYISSSHVPTNLRKFIWFSFLYVAEEFLSIGPILPLKFFYRFSGHSSEIEKYLKVLRLSSPFRSIFFVENDKTTMTDEKVKLPMLLSAVDILRIRNVSGKEYRTHEYMMGPLFIREKNYNRLHSLGGIFIYHKKNNNYIEKRIILRREEKELKIDTKTT